MSIYTVLYNSRKSAKVKKRLTGFYAIHRSPALMLFPVLVLLSFQSFSKDPYATEKKIIRLSHDWGKEMKIVAENEGLKSFCNNDSQRQAVFNLLDEIHYYNDLLKADLQSSTYYHSGSTIRRLLNQIGRLDADYHPDGVADFFREQCWLRSRTEKNFKIYNTGFGTHSYGGIIYMQDALIHWYLKRLSKRIGRIKKHVERLYVRRMVRETNSTLPSLARE